MSTHHGNKVRIYVTGGIATQVAQALADNPETELHYEVVPIGEDNLDLLRDEEGNCVSYVLEERDDVEFQDRIDAMKKAFEGVGVAFVGMTEALLEFSEIDTAFVDRTPFHHAVNQHSRSARRRR